MLVLYGGWRGRGRKESNECRSSRSTARKCCLITGTFTSLRYKYEVLMRLANRFWEGNGVAMRDVTRRKLQGATRTRFSLERARRRRLAFHRCTLYELQLAPGEMNINKIINKTINRGAISTARDRFSAVKIFTDEARRKKTIRHRKFRAPYGVINERERARNNWTT